MSKPKKKNRAGRRGSPKSTCLDGRLKNTASASSTSVKLQPMSDVELIAFLGVVRSGSEPISEADFDRFMGGVLFRTAGVRLKTQAQVDEYRRTLARSVGMPVTNKCWREVIKRGGLAPRGG